MKLLPPASYDASMNFVRVTLDDGTQADHAVLSDDVRADIAKRYPGRAIVTLDVLNVGVERAKPGVLVSA